MPSERADRLGASLRLFGLVREPAPAAIEAAAAVPLLSAEEWDAWRDTDDDDLALSRACLAAEFELRDAGWGWLEFLLHVSTAPAATTAPVAAGGGASAGPGEGAAALVLIPRAQAVAVAMQALSWHLPPPIEDDGA